MNIFAECITASNLMQYLLMPWSRIFGFNLRLFQLMMYSRRITVRDKRNDSDIAFRCAGRVMVIVYVIQVAWQQYWG
jgi:predicted permease